MRRFWYLETLQVGQNLSLSDELYHHIVDVCRFRAGDRFELLNEQRQAALVQVTELDKKQVRVEVLQVRELPAVPRPWIHLYLAIPKFATFEIVLEKAVELGVHKITPVLSEFSFVRTADKVDERRMARWQKIRRQAMQQTGRGQLLELATAQPLKAVLKGINQDPRVKGLFMYEGDAKRSLRTALASFKSNPIDEIAVFVGSEGGFSHAEVEMFQSHGLEPISLGEQILRVETACVTLFSVIKYEFDILG